MSASEDRFQEQWERLQAGERLDDVQTNLPADESELLAFAAGLVDLPFPARKQRVVASQRAHLLSLAACEHEGESPLRQAPARPVQRPFWRSLVPQSPLVCRVAAALLLVAAIAWAGTAWNARITPKDTPTRVAMVPTEWLGPTARPATALPTVLTASATAPAPAGATALEVGTEPARMTYVSPVLKPMGPEDAILRDSRGLVQVRHDQASWEVAEAGEVVGAGWHVRTGALSTVRLAFYDGSSARLAPNSELSLAALGLLPDSGARQIELRQQLGESDHTVAPAPDGRYVVHTSAGSGAALGTIFHVSVRADTGTRFSVTEGAVEVTHLEATVVVVAGQETLVEPEGPPEEPAFRIYGEGHVEEIGAVWRIGGQSFETHVGTRILGDPRVGDRVAVEGRLAPDGTRLADRIELLERAPAEGFSLIGPVEEMGAAAWIVAGQMISITAETDVEAGLQVEDWVEVTGILLEDSIRQATRIRSLGDPAGQPFRFVGVLDDMTDDLWSVSGILVSMDAETARDDDLAVGDLVEVGGWITAEGEWLARSVRRVLAEENVFVFSGMVQAIDPWVVAGIALETRDWSEIEPGITVEDRVQVRGRILADGSWLATEIELLAPETWPSLDFVGVVEATSPWTVEGIAFVLDEESEIHGEIAVGDLVHVKAVGLPDGAWLLRELERLAETPDGGCMWFTAVVGQVAEDQIVLHHGPALPFGPQVLVEGDLQRGSVISFYLCLDAEGRSTLLSVMVLYQLELEPEPTPTAEPSPTPADEPAHQEPAERPQDKVIICHKPDKKGGGKTMTLPWEAWVNGHQQHGDTLGPCP